MIASRVLVVLTALTSTFAVVTADKRLSTERRHVAQSAGPSTEMGTAAISGMVHAAIGTAPLVPGRRAIVTLKGGVLSVGRSAVTDDHGQFTIDRLPAGRFMLTVTKPAFLPAAYGATRPGRSGVPIVLANGQQLGDLSITLTRGAVIAGTVRESTGASVAGVMVLASRVLPDGSVTAGATTASDDRGRYRVFGLPAGTYLVSATRQTIGPSGDVTEMTSEIIDRKLEALRGGQPAAGQPPAATTRPTTRDTTSTFVPVYFPHAFSAADATPVTVGFGDERADIDILFARAHSVSVEGTITGAPAPALTITMSQTVANPSGPALAARQPGDGPFRFTGVTPGRHTIMARTPIGMRPILFARAEVEVTGDVTGIALVLRPALRLTGRLVCDATRLIPPAELSTVHVRLEDAMPRVRIGGAGGGGRGGQPSDASTTDAVGNFVVDDVLPGTYRVTASLAGGSAGWWLRSAVINGRDVLDVLLEIDATTPLSGLVLTFSDRRTELSGRIEPPAGRSPSEYYIVVFPEERAMWRPGARRIQSTRAGTDAAYVVRDLPPGAYRIAALTDVSPDDLIDPAFFEMLLPSSVPFTLDDGEQKTQSLKVGGAAR